MKKLMIGCLLFSLILFAVSASLSFLLGSDFLLSLAITFGTTGYHFGMRLLVGLLFNRIMKNKADYTRSWYRTHAWEPPLYKVLNV